MTATPRHVIFGTGAIGLATLDALRRRGETVRLVNRSGHAPVPDDVEVIAGDARDPAFTTTVAQGAQVIYQTLNPPYAEWTAQFPLLQAGVPHVGNGVRRARPVRQMQQRAIGRVAVQAAESLDQLAHVRRPAGRVGIADRDWAGAVSAGRRPMSTTVSCARDATRR